MAESYGSSPALNAEATALPSRTPMTMTAKLNGIDSQAWLADVLVRLPNTPVSRLPDLLP